jgi:hypothetical protein
MEMVSLLAILNARAIDDNMTRDFHVDLRYHSRRGGEWMTTQVTGILGMLTVLLFGCGQSGIATRSVDGAADGTSGLGGSGVLSRDGATGQGGIGGGGPTSVGGSQAGGTPGSGGATGGTGGGAATPLQMLANAFCTAARNCCAQGSYSMSQLNDCETKFPSRLPALSLVDRGIVLIDGVALEACTNAYVQAVTTCTINGVYAACGAVFVGTKAENQPCSSVVECNSNSGPETCFWTESTVDPAAVGVCIKTPTGKRGDPCSYSCASNSDCSVTLYGNPTSIATACFEKDGLYCATSGASPVCATIVAVGDSCTSDSNACGSANYCDWTSSACKAARELGQLCGVDSCVSGLMCGTDNNCDEMPFASDYLCQGSPPAP